jgi:hypothetical protein
MEPIKARHLLIVCLVPFLTGCPPPSTVDTIESMYSNSHGLRNAFNLQSAKVSQGLTNDCPVFDAKKVCVSFVGAKSDGHDGLDGTTGALILAHRPRANIHFGGYLDQTFESAESGGFRVKRGSPGYGLFGVWSQNADGSGIQFRAAVNYGAVDIETTRISRPEPTPEVRLGTSDIKSVGIQLEVSRDYALTNSWSARPYAGIRQTLHKRAAYSETDGPNFFPLAYTDVKQNVQSLLAGVGVSGLIASKTTMMWSAGLEHDISNHVDPYFATRLIDDLDAISMDSGAKKTRPTVSLGFTQNIDKTQRIGFTITHRKEAFESASTTSGVFQYSKGF